tara:strand:+ start:3793 stop:5064 length:1272 start_codon:yes stop_codon:yes gene_type:complete
MNNKLLNKRNINRKRAEKRFQLYGIVSIILAVAFLAVLIGSMLVKSLPAFTQTLILLEIHLDRAEIDPNFTDRPDIIGRADYRKIAKKAILSEFPSVKTRRDKRSLLKIYSRGVGFQLRSHVMHNPHLIGKKIKLWVQSSSDVDYFMKGGIDRGVSETERKIKDIQLLFLDRLVRENKIKRSFNSPFFTLADSREPEQAGILGAVIGSFFTLLVTLILVFPVGVSSAIYLEEFAPKNKWTDLIEININNLAAVPSIVFGLLGLAVLLNFFDLPRSTPIVGGIVLALMTLPTVIISARSSIMAVPPSIREAALGIGASPMQTVLHHVFPLALPGMLTGTIIGMARALGETAPLLMIGMVAFIVDLPRNLTDAATVLPVQIFLWADAPERAFAERTAAATIVLLVFLILMNLVAIMLRKKFERRW